MALSSAATAKPMHSRASGYGGELYAVPEALNFGRLAARGLPRWDSAGPRRGTPTLHQAFPSDMQILIVTLSASVALVAFGLSGGHAQVGFCQYQYKHCVARCASKVIKIKRRCVPACQMQLHHCKTPDPHLGELTGTR